MPRPCSADPRERALAAYEEANEGGRARVAGRYRAGERTLSGWLRVAREEGRRSPKPRARRPAPSGGEGAALAMSVAEQDDATLAGYADRPAERTGVRRSLAAVRWALRRLGLARKKRRFGPPGGTAGTSPRRGRDGVPSWSGSGPSA